MKTETESKRPGRTWVYLFILLGIVGVLLLLWKQPGKQPAIHQQASDTTTEDSQSRSTPLLEAEADGTNDEIASSNSNQRLASAIDPIEIFGRVILKGNPPAERVIYEQHRADGTVLKVRSRNYEVSKSGGLANAFVYVKGGLEGRSFRVPAEPLRLQQKDFFLRPFVVGVRVDQQIQIENPAGRESLGHQFGLVSSSGSKYLWPREDLLELVFSGPDVFSHITCESHPWEWAYFGAVTHPYFAVTDTEGYFKLPKGIAPGTYELAVRHPKAGEATERIEMKGGKYNVIFSLAVPQTATNQPAATAPLVEREDAPLEGPKVLANAAKENAAISGTPVGESWNSGGIIRGKVTLNGTPPPEKPLDVLKNDPNCGKLIAAAPSTRFYVTGEDQGLADTVVYLEFDSPPETPFPKKREPLLIDQVNCEYLPYITAAQTGQKIVVRNSDPLFHNVHTTPTAAGNRAMNRGHMPKAPDLEFVFENPELFLRFKCDVHPWMFSYVSVFDHPFFAVTDANGNFSITNVPPGQYTLRAAHRRSGNTSKAVTVQPGKSSEVGFVLTVQ